MNINLLTKCSLIAASLIIPTITQAGSATLVVSGQSNPWLATQPSGTVTSDGQDSAPAQSPALVPLSVAGGVQFSFSGVNDPTQGSVGNCPGCQSGSPNGGGFTTHSAGAQNGISDVNAPLNSLLGVFVSSSLSPTAPAPLDFSTIVGFTSLSPLLQQVFFIGTGAGETFYAPTGATQLYLGTMDGYQWSNNVGAYDVTVTSTPSPPHCFLLRLLWQVCSDFRVAKLPMV